MALAITLPTPTGDSGTWGAELNAAIQTIVNYINAMTGANVGLGNVPNVDATQRSNHIGVQPTSSLSDFTTALFTQLQTMVVGDGSTINVSAASNILTLSTKASIAFVPATYNGSIPTRASVTSNLSQPVVWIFPTSVTIPVDDGVHAISDVDILWPYS